MDRSYRRNYGIFILIFLFCCSICTPFLISMPTRDVLAFEEAYNRDQKLGELFVERANAVLLNQFDEIQKLDKEIELLGMNEISFDDAVNLFSPHDPSIELFEKEYEDDKYSYFEGNVDFYHRGKEYSYTILNVTPKTPNCSMGRTGDIDRIIQNYGQMSQALIFETFYNVFSTVAQSIPKVGPALTVLQVLLDEYGAVEDFFVDKNESEGVSSSYGWNIVETASFILTNSPSVPGIRIQVGYYNVVSGVLSGYVNSVDSSSGVAMAKQTDFKESFYWRAPNFTNGALAMAHFIDYNEHYIERLEKVELRTPLEGNDLVTVIELQNPNSLVEVF